MKTLAEILIPPLDQSFSYLVPETFEVQVGCQVKVPFGARTATGYIIGLQEADEKELSQIKYKLKPINSKEKAIYCFNSQQADFFKWVSQYYASPISTVIDVAIPKCFTKKIKKIITLNQQYKEAEVTLRGKLQKQIIEHLQASDGIAEYSLITKTYKNSHAAIKRLVELDLIKITTEDITTSAGAKHKTPDWAKTEVTLNEQQTEAKNNALTASAAGEFQPILLHGVTGSGKTEVYIEIIAELVKQDRGALVIVPEIALTPQLLDRFTARLGTNIALLHSGMSARLRWEAWEALLEARCKIAIGARSAVFAPVQDLGVVIVDEEHDQSFKQSDGLRYHGRDCAVMLAKMNECPLILGSATPSLESYYNAQTNKYHLISLPQRHGKNQTIDCQLIDCSTKRPWEMAAPHVSKELHQAMSSALSEGGQIFILYNRRGFASYLQCLECQEVLSCPNCEVTLTLHLKNHSLRCHYCGYNQVPPKWCPSCSDQQQQLVERGAGTERIVDEIRELFPDVTLDRLDRDSVRTHDQYKKILERVRSGTTRILVGTQMIAKGHDLPEVTLVGIADCDVGLHMPDFRASERVYQLLTQAAGRTGRGQRSGKVILQTRVAKHPSLHFTMNQSYTGFAKHELANRKALAYPPYSRLLRILVQATENEIAQKTLHDLYLVLKKLQIDNDMEVQLLGPTQAPLAKLKTRWRWHLLCKSKSLKNMHQILYTARKQKIAKNVRVSFDLDPHDLL